MTYEMNVTAMSEVMAGMQTVLEEQLRMLEHPDSAREGKDRAGEEKTK